MILVSEGLPGLTCKEIQKMISDVDDDGSGTIGYEEFLKMMTHKILNRDPKDEILKAFRLFDDDETGKISFKNLKRVAKELGERMTDEELQEMIDEADRDGDGEVNEEEFLRIMKKTNLFWARLGRSWSSLILSSLEFIKGCLLRVAQARLQGMPWLRPGIATCWTCLTGESDTVRVYIRMYPSMEYALNGKWQKTRPLVL